jgi:hypothetical protein
VNKNRAIATEASVDENLAAIENDQRVSSATGGAGLMNPWRRLYV